jgi:uncharacterized protein (TIGR02147 family)
METSRPQIQSYTDAVEFVRDMLQYRRQSEDGFSVLKATRPLRRVSPALISLILQRKRKLTLDRSDELARLLKLNSAEKFYFRNWLEPDKIESEKPPHKHRKDVSTHLLNDWLNVYVKDFFLIPEVRKNPEMVKSLLRHIAKPDRIERSIRFLLREGYLRRTLAGQVELDTHLAVADPGVPNQKIRQFHKAALKIAHQGLDFYDSSERIANALILPLDAEAQTELRELLNDFSERLKDFAARHTKPSNRLYQLIINLSPLGGPTK